MVRFQSTVKLFILFLATWVGVMAISSCSGTVSPEYDPIPPSEGRLIEHAEGETVVPQTPKRVVVLGPVADALALGIKPVGAALMGIPQRAGAEQLSPLLGDRTEGIAILGRSNQPSLEKMTTLEPDLILGSKGVHGSLYRQLSQIAPTVVVDLSRGAEHWQDYVLKAATAMGKQAEAEALIQHYEQRVAEFQQLMGDRLERTTVSLVRFRPSQVRIYQAGSFAGAVLDEVGLPRPAAQQQHKPYETISLESIPQMEADVLFFMQDNPEQSTLGQVKVHPLWSRLEVVQQDRVYEVSLEAWFLNAGIVSAHLILNDLFRTLVPDGEQYLVKQVGTLELP